MADELLNTQKQLLYEIIKVNGFNPDAFDLRKSLDQDGNQLSGNTIHHKGTGFWFVILVTSRGFEVYYRPGEQSMQGSDSTYYWRDVGLFFARWLSYLSQETTTPDPWAAATEYAEIVDSIPREHQQDRKTKNESVSAVERDAIWKALGAIQATLLEHVHDSKEKHDFIVQEINVLKDAASKFGKKDYLMLLYSGIIGVITTVGATPEMGVAILEILKQAASGILHLK